MTTPLALLFAFCAHASLGTGNVLMKRGISWIGWKGKKGNAYFKALLVWTTGFLVMNSSGVFTALSVKRLTPQIVGVFAGPGILVMILLSGLLLKEPFFRSDIIGAFMIVSSVALLGLLPNSISSGTWKYPGIVSLSITLVVPIVFLIIGLSAKKRSAPALALCSGLSSGILIILLKILVARFGFDLKLYLNSVFLYLYILFAVLALISLQMGLKRGPMMVVGPVQYGSLILYPAVTAPLFAITPSLLQWPFFIICATGIWIIMRKR